MTHDEFTRSAWPARHLIDLDSYRYQIDGHKATSVVAQLGCPFQCSFCAGRLSPMLRKIRLRDRSNVIDELRMLHMQYGYTGFMFYDDELNVNKNLVPLMRDLIALQKELGVRFALRGFVKSELFNEEQAEVLHEAGFNWLLCGFESGSPRILRNIRKMATTEDNSRMLQIAHQYGIRVKALMSVGHAGESPETIAETEQWLIDERPDEFDATVITVYPGRHTMIRLFIIKMTSGALRPTVTRCTSTTSISLKNRPTTKARRANTNLSSSPTTSQGPIWCGFVTALKSGSVAN